MSDAIFPAGIRGLAFTVTKTAEFATAIQTSPSRGEVRIPLQQNPIWTFQLIYEVLLDRGVLSPYAYSEYRALQGFFLARQGGADDFLLNDPTDNFVGPGFAGGTISPIIFNGGDSHILTSQLDQAGAGYANGDTVNVAGGSGTALLQVSTVILPGFSITAVNQGTQTFTVAGDQTLSFGVGGTANVLLSTANDGAYTIVSATLNAGNTDVAVSQPIPSPIADGDLYGSLGFVNAYTLLNGGTGYAPATNVATVPVSSAGVGFTVDILTVSGTGTSLLDDLSIFPQSGPAATGTYTVTIDSTGTPDTFAFTGPVFGNAAVPIIAGQYVYLGAGVYIAFRSATGHTLGSTWTFNTVAGTPNMGAQQQVVTDGLGNYYSPIQRNFGGQFYEDVTDFAPASTAPFLSWALQLYANGVLMTQGGDYEIRGPGLNIPGFQSEGLYAHWLAGAPTGPVTAEFFFYFRVRFSEDRQDFEQFTHDFWTIGGSEGKNSTQLALESARPVFGSQDPT